MLEDAPTGVDDMVDSKDLRDLVAGWRPESIDVFLDYYAHYAFRRPACQVNSTESAANMDDIFQNAVPDTGRASEDIDQQELHIRESTTGNTEKKVLTI